MAKRIVDRYPPGTAVEILRGEQWQKGEVVRADFPAVWVRTEDGREWFVTNSRRIRLDESDGLKNKSVGV